MRDVEAIATPHLFTVAEYMTLGIDARTELLGGIIYDVSPKNEPHSRMVSRLAKFLNRTLSDDDEVRVQDPIAVSGWTSRDAPEIDIAVIAAKAYSRTPTAADSAAFIEVSDTTSTRAFDHGSSTSARAASSHMRRPQTSNSNTAESSKRFACSMLTSRPTACFRFASTTFGARPIRTTRGRHVAVSTQHAIVA